jgi:hypothetical protein
MAVGMLPRTSSTIEKQVVLVAIVVKNTIIIPTMMETDIVTLAPT